jgi:hypothetical protein
MKGEELGRAESSAQRTKNLRNYGISVYLFSLNSLRKHMPPRLCCAPNVVDSGSSKSMCIIIVIVSNAILWSVSLRL